MPKKDQQSRPAPAEAIQQFVHISVRLFDPNVRILKLE
jgi:hypothetical protein